MVPWEIHRLSSSMTFRGRYRTLQTQVSQYNWVSQGKLHPRGVLLRAMSRSRFAIINGRPVSDHARDGLMNELPCRLDIKSIAPRSKQLRSSWIVETSLTWDGQRRWDLCSRWHVGSLLQVLVNSPGLPRILSIFCLLVTAINSEGLIFPWLMQAGFQGIILILPEKHHAILIGL